MKRSPFVYVVISYNGEPPQLLGRARTTRGVARLVTRDREGGYAHTSSSTPPTWAVTVCGSRARLVELGMFCGWLLDADDARVARCMILREGERIPVRAPGHLNASLIASLTNVGILPIQTAHLFDGYHRRRIQHAVLAQDRAQIGGQAPRPRRQRVAAESVVLRAVDVDREAALALAEEHAAGGRHGEAGEVASGRGGHRGARLVALDVAPQGRSAQPLALAESDENSDLTGSDRTTEAHVISLAERRQRRKRHAAGQFAVLWFDWRAGRVSITVEHVDPITMAGLRGWVELRPGAWRKRVSIPDLSSELSRLGAVLSS